MSTRHNRLKEKNKEKKRGKVKGEEEKCGESIFL
jgi:hypothetical protein